MSSNDFLLTPEDLAERWNISKGTLANWRSSRQGPSFVKLGSGVVRYRLTDVRSFEDANLEIVE